MRKDLNDLERGLRLEVARKQGRAPAAKGLSQKDLDYRREGRRVVVATSVDRGWTYEEFEYFSKSVFELSAEVEAMKKVKEMGLTYYKTLSNELVRVTDK